MVITLVSSCYYVPSTKARLLNPHRLFCAAKGVSGRFITSKNDSILEFDGVGSIEISHDINNHLPIGLGRNSANGSVSYLAEQKPYTFTKVITTIACEVWP